MKYHKNIFSEKLKTMMTYFIEHVFFKLNKSDTDLFEKIYYTCIIFIFIILIQIKNFAHTIFNFIKYNYKFCKYENEN